MSQDLQAKGTDASGSVVAEENTRSNSSEQHTEREGRKMGDLQTWPTLDQASKPSEPTTDTQAKDGKTTDPSTTDSSKKINWMPMDVNPGATPHRTNQTQGQFVSTRGSGGGKPRNRNNNNNSSQTQDNNTESAGNSAESNDDANNRRGANRSTRGNNRRGGRGGQRGGARQNSSAAPFIPTYPVAPIGGLLVSPESFQ